LTGCLEDKENEMKNRLRLSIVILTLVGVTLACNMPAVGQEPGGQVNATPNLTMTALFESGLLGSLTPQAPSDLVPSITPNPTDPFVLQPTAAVLPTNTSALPTITSAPGQNPTQTPPATLTPLPASPTPLPTQVRARSSQVKAYFQSSALTIDGVWDEWTTPAYPATFVTYGRENWVDGNDLEGSFRLGWDQTYLYIAVKVIDDKYVQNSVGQDIYLGDSIELLLDRDLLGDFFDASLSQDDFQLGISPGNPDVGVNREAYLWFPSHMTGARSDIKIGSVRASGVTRIEAAIPWSTFGIVPAVDQRYGFVLSASDNDTSGTQRQESMVSSTRNRRLTDPTTWGEMLLSR
jgi:hypothetical protein